MQVLKKVGLFLFGLMILGAVAGGGKGGGGGTGGAVAGIDQGTARRNIEVTLDGVKREGFGMFMTANFRIMNRNDFAVKDLEILCSHSAGSGTIMDTNTRTVNEFVKARGYLFVNDFNMGFISSQATRSSCEVKSFTKA